MIKVAYSHQRPTKYRTGGYCAQARWEFGRATGLGDSAEEAISEALRNLHEYAPETRAMPVTRVGRVSHARLEVGGF